MSESRAGSGSEAESVSDGEVRAMDGLIILAGCK